MRKYPDTEASRISHKLREAFWCWCDNCRPTGKCTENLGYQSIFCCKVCHLISAQHKQVPLFGNEYDGIHPQLGVQDGYK